jgi:hypothetical protein
MQHRTAEHIDSAAGDTRCDEPRLVPPPPSAHDASAPAVAEQVAASPSPPAIRTRSRRRSLAYGLAGFVLGAAFWHVVGFWDFVGRVMFKGADQTADVVAAIAPDVKLRERVSGVGSLAITLSSETCTSLSLDRATGQTRAEPCSQQQFSLRSLKPARREDLWLVGGLKKNEQPLQGWSTVVVDAID